MYDVHNKHTNKEEATTKSVRTYSLQIIKIHGTSDFIKYCAKHKAHNRHFTLPYFEMHHGKVFQNVKIVRCN